MCRLLGALPLCFGDGLTEKRRVIDKNRRRSHREMYNVLTEIVVGLIEKVKILCKPFGRPRGNASAFMLSGDTRRVYPYIGVQ